MKKKFLFVAAAAVALSSCSKNEVSISMDDDRAIGFGVYTGVANRGAVVDNDALQKDGFGVFGFYTKDKAFIGSEAANFMYDQEVSIKDGSWTYNPMKYWSEHVNDKYTFYAYHPYADDNAQVSVVGDNTKHPKVKVTVPATVGDMVDFVADVKVDAISGADGDVDGKGDDADKVVFSMQHEMTRVAVMLKSDVKEDTHGEEKTTIVVKNIKFQGAKFATTGTYTFATNNKARGTWSNTGNAILVPSLKPNNVAIGSYAKEQGVAVKNNANTPTNLFGDKEYLFLLPPNGTEGLGVAGKIAIELTYDIVTEDGALQYGCTASRDNVKTVEIPAGSLGQGKAYNYILTFSMNEVKLSANVDETWGTGSSIGVTGGTEE